jgi:cytochrome c oxidase assembly factor CtaG
LNASRGFVGAAVLLAVLVQIPPAAHLAQESFAMHMFQHVVLMSFVPPLLVLGRPRGLRLNVEPWTAWLGIALVMGVWHIPWLYDLALRQAWLHALEHASLIVFGTLFWIPVLCGRLDSLRSVVYVIAGSVPGWVLALVLTFAQHPLYPAYAALPHRLGGLSAVADQQAAAGVMVAIGSIPFAIAVFVYLYRWVGTERSQEVLPAA